MPTINWDENKPAGQDSLGLGDDEIRSLKTALRAGLGAEHAWPSTGGDAGTHLLGSARAFYGLQSLVSSTGTDGRLMFTSDTARLFHVGSNGSDFIGANNVLQLTSDPASISHRGVWNADLVYGVAGSIVFPNSGYSGVPFAFLSCIPNTGPTIVNLTAVTNTTASYNALQPDGTDVTSSTTVFCFSIGTRTL